MVIIAATTMRNSKRSPVVTPITMAAFEPLFSGVEEAVAMVVVAATADNEPVNECDILFPGA